MFGLDYHKLAFSVFITLIAILATACGPRVVISTGTTLGLKATPGDGYTRPPQVTLAYKRMESSFIPTKGDLATKTEDAFSTFAALHFSTKWFGETQLRSIVGSGIAAQDMLASPSFGDQFAKATIGVVPEDIQKRRVALISRWQKLSEDEANRALEMGDYAKKPNKTAKQSLHDYIGDSQADTQLVRLESSFLRIQQDK